MSTPIPAQTFVRNCGCGSTGQVVLGHYEIGRCPCGRFFWALQPKRNGPLALFPWPGPTLTKWQLEEQDKNAN